MNKMLGIILILVGIVGLAWGGFSFTTREKIVDLGPIHASWDKNHSVPLRQSPALLLWWAAWRF